MVTFLRRKGIIDIVLGLVAVGALGLVARIGYRASRPSLPPPADVRWRDLDDVTSLADRGQWLGESSARLQLVEFSDIECPFCRRLHSDLTELIRRHPRDVAVLFRHYPSRGHFQSLPAAIAAECAAMQGRFEPYVSLLFVKQDSLGILPWELLASRAGIPDTFRFKVCRSDSTVRRTIDEDIQVGRRLKIPGTPALILGRRMFTGAVPLDTLEALVRAAVAVK
jgi:protein-disulfide isomerase